MKWPTGRWNGLRIVGVFFKIHVDVTDWIIRPVFPNRYGRCFAWLCFRVWFGWNYESRFDWANRELKKVENERRSG